MLLHALVSTRVKFLAKIIHVADGGVGFANVCRGKLARAPMAVVRVVGFDNLAGGSG